MKPPIKALGVLCLAAAIFWSYEDNSVSDKNNQTAQPGEVSPRCQPKKKPTSASTIFIPAARTSVV
jgi:hypothetical protein